MLNILIILLGYNQLACSRYLSVKSDNAYSSIKTNLLNQKPLGKY